MPKFAYRAVTPTGRTVRDVEEAASSLALEGVLRARGLLPLDVSEPRGAASSRRRWTSRRSDVVEGVRYLATLIEADFPLDRALATVARVVLRNDVADAFRAVREKVRAGISLAAALAEHPRVFSRLAVGMALAGERGGHLAEALATLADHLEREDRLRSQLVSAMLYPATMALVGGGAVLLLLVYVLPRFVGIIDDAGAALPRSTALLIDTSAFVGHWWPVLILFAVVTIGLLASYRRTESGRLTTDALLLRVPIVGGLRQQLTAARFGRTFGTLLHSGLPILQSLDIAGSALTDAAASREIERAREEIQAGVAVAPALGRGRAFPFIFHQMVELGEEAGRLPEMLERAATAAERDLERGLDRLVRLVEPAMIVLFGGVAGFVAMALLQAIYALRVDSL